MSHEDIPQNPSDDSRASDHFFQGVWQARVTISDVDLDRQAATFSQKIQAWQGRQLFEATRSSRSPQNIKSRLGHSPVVGSHPNMAFLLRA